MIRAPSSQRGASLCDEDLRICAYEMATLALAACGYGFTIAFVSKATPPEWANALPFNVAPVAMVMA